VFLRLRLRIQARVGVPELIPYSQAKAKTCDSFDKSYVTWINDGTKAWTLMGAGMGPDAETEIHGRPVPEEPMVHFMVVLENIG